MAGAAVRVGVTAASRGIQTATKYIPTATRFVSNIGSQSAAAPTMPMATQTTSMVSQGRQMGTQIKENVDPGTLAQGKKYGIIGLSLFNGFIPMNPLYWVYQIPLFIMIVMIFAFIFEFSWKTSFIMGYIGMALTTTIINYIVFHAASSIFLGI